MTPEEATQLFGKCALFKHSTTALQHEIKNAGKIIEANSSALISDVATSSKIPEATKVFVASLDGTNVMLRESGTRMGAKIKRPVTEDKIDDNKTCYKNAMVGTVSFYELRKKDEKHPNRLGTLQIGRMPEDKSIKFKEEYEHLLRQTLDNAENTIGTVQKILLLDGARSLWNYAQENPLFVDFEKCLDFYHVTEHLSKAAELIFGKGSEKAKSWYGKYRQELLDSEGTPFAVARSIAYYYLPMRKGERKKALKTELTFFKKNANKMQFPRFLQAGWPIGSGPVEAAGKSLVKTRLCRSGMRWSRKGGQAILSLRAQVKSNTWNIFWPAYRKKKLIYAEEKRKGSDCLVAA
jgi:hypothetical protein